ncbi:MAG: hypothetical protein IJX40_00360 [Alistipes sp.]|nr:hypothetical protein [Alistipes sp.]
MEDKIKSLPAKAQLQRRALRIVLLSAIMLIINHQFTPGQNWGVWATVALCASFLFDLIDYVIIKRNTKEEE